MKFAFIAKHRGIWPALEGRGGKFFPVFTG
jgi:hypothetical protein